MGGLRKLMPVTFVTYAIGMMALSGVPLFFAGAWTKEEVLHATAHWPKSPVPYYLMLAGVVFTLQGVGVLGGSVMSSVTFWAVAGPVIALAGLVLAVIGLR